MNCNEFELKEFDGEIEILINIKTGKELNISQRDKIQKISEFCRSKVIETIENGTHKAQIINKKG